MDITANSEKNIMPYESIKLTDEGLTAFKKAVKVGIYKNLLKEEIINITEFSKLMQIINRKPENALHNFNESC